MYWLTAAAQAITSPSPSATTISHRSVLAENANLHQRISDLEDRLSELLGQQAFERSGLGAPTNTTALQAELEQQRQATLDLNRALEERDEELAARETNRRLMAQLNHTTDT